jgi:uncharacterized MAPEG superfamily protein
MTTELKLLAWTLVLALVQVALTAILRTRETGLAYNAGPRDQAGPPVGRFTGRMTRAQKNLFETLPVFAAAILIAHVGGRNGALTWWGAMLYFWARVVYVPLYGLGIPYIRSLVWTVGLVGVVLIIWAILTPA